MECGDLELGLFSFTFGSMSLDAIHLPLLVLPLPDLIPGSPVMAYSLLAGRLVHTFAHSIALLLWVAMGYLSWCVCWVDSYDFVCWVWVQGRTGLLGTLGILANGVADVVDFLLSRLCRLGYTVRHSLSCCTRRVVSNNTNPRDLKKKEKK